MKPAPALEFSYIEERNNPFLGLFPHRFDYIWAEYPALPSDKVNWQTEIRYPLSDRHIEQQDRLFGVRFGTETQYCLLDIDRHSIYHPQQDPFAIARITGELEALGLTNFLICTSSYSGGIHLYFPFGNAQNSWKLAIALTTLLTNAGFQIAAGQLEIFPNPKTYSIDSKPSLFNAHRLPLQIGSYLLNSDFQPTWSDRQQFVQQWQFAQTRNTIESRKLNQLVKQSKRKHYHISGKAEKFLRDLDTEIALGWTDFGQTNRLLGRITMRAYIFHHVTQGESPLTGQALINEVVNVARSLPGYHEWCRHQHEIEQRAAEWVRCIENSHYFHYSDPAGKYKAKTTATNPIESVIEEIPTWNQQQSETAREKIRSAIADLLEQNCLPIGATARFKVLTKQYAIGGGSLYRHRDLWHPSHLSEGAELDPQERKIKDLDSELTRSELSEPELTNPELTGSELIGSELTRSELEKQIENLNDRESISGDSITTGSICLYDIESKPALRQTNDAGIEQNYLSLLSLLGGNLSSQQGCSYAAFDCSLYLGSNCLIDRLAQDLQRSFPEQKAFSAPNLKYMRAFAEAYPDEEFVQQATAQISCFHNCVGYRYKAGWIWRDRGVRSAPLSRLKRVALCLIG